MHESYVPTIARGRLGKVDTLGKEKNSNYFKTIVPYDIRPR